MYIYIIYIYNMYYTGSQLTIDRDIDKICALCSEEYHGNFLQILRLIYVPYGSKFS